MLKHWQEHQPDLATHSVELEAGTLLHSIFKKDKLMVNSFHHQIVKDVPEAFTVAARAMDGVVEALEHHSYPFMVGVQWHPEMLHKSMPEMNQLFKALIAQAKRKQNTDCHHQTEKVS